MSGRAAAEYLFRFSGSDVVVALGDELVIYDGARPRRLALADVEAFTVDRLNTLSHQLVLAIRRTKARFELVRIDADVGEPEFDTLIDALAALRPEADSRDEALSTFLKRYGAPGFTAREVFWVAIVVLVAGVEWLLLPSLRHALDTGEERIDAGKVHRAKLTTRNLVLTGVIDTERSYQILRGPQGPLLYVPIFSAHPTDDFIPVLLETHDLKTSEWHDLAARKEWPCVLRDLPAENFSSQFANANTTRLTAEQQQALAGAQICTLRDAETEHHDLNKFLGANAAMVSVLFGIAWVLRMKNDAPAA